MEIFVKTKRSAHSSTMHDFYLLKPQINSFRHLSTFELLAPSRWCLFLDSPLLLSSQLTIVGFCLHYIAYKCFDALPFCYDFSISFTIFSGEMFVPSCFLSLSFATRSRAVEQRVSASSFVSLHSTHLSFCSFLNLNRNALKQPCPVKSFVK